MVRPRAAPPVRYIDKPLFEIIYPVRVLIAVIHVLESPAILDISFFEPFPQGGLSLEDIIQPNILVVEEK